MDAFVRLLGQKPMDKITVRDICKECDISRNTFYYHFDDIYALLKASISRSFERVTRASFDEDWKDTLQHVFEAAIDSRRLVYHVYYSINHAILEQYLYECTSKLFEGYVRKAAEGLTVSEDDLHFIWHAYQSMAVGMLLEWIRNGMPDGYTQTLDCAHRLLLGKTRRLLEFDLIADGSF